MKTIGKRIVNEFDWGVYVLQMPDGSVVMDEDENFLLVQCKENDIEMLKKLRDAAHSYGIFGAIPRFLPGRRMVTDEEFEEQRLRAVFGLIPDPKDPGVIMDKERGIRYE